MSHLMFLSLGTGELAGGAVLVLRVMMMVSGHVDPCKISLNASAELGLGPRPTVLPFQSRCSQGWPGWQAWTAMDHILGT